MSVLLHNQRTTTTPPTTSPPPTTSIFRPTTLSDDDSGVIKRGSRFTRDGFTKREPSSPSSSSTSRPQFAVPSSSPPNLKSLQLLFSNIRHSYQHQQQNSSPGLLSAPSFKSDGVTRADLFRHRNRLFSPPHNSSQSTESATCSICGKVFHGGYCKYNLKKHLTIHAGMRPFSCSFCEKTFNQKCSMKRHVIMVHGVNPIESAEHLNDATTPQGHHDRYHPPSTEEISALSAEDHLHPHSSPSRQQRSTIDERDLEQRVTADDPGSHRDSSDEDATTN